MEKNEEKDKTNKVVHLNDNFIQEFKQLKDKGLINIRMSEYVRIACDEKLLNLKIKLNNQKLIENEEKNKESSIEKVDKASIIEKSDDF